MAFLNSALLWGLVAAALPLLIHLFNRRKFRQIDFSTLRFLRRLQNQQMRRLRLRQWLLLLLRTLAAFLIAFAFVRPALKGPSALPTLSDSRISLVLILDASASMQAQAEGGSCFDLAKNAADTLLTMMNSGDQALIILASSVARTLLPSFSDDPAALRRALRAARPGDGNADLAAALELANQRLRAASAHGDFRREVYLISDFASLSELPDPPPQTVPILVQTKAQSSENLAVADPQIGAELPESGQPLEIAVTFANFGPRPREGVYTSVLLDGQRIAEDVVSLPPLSQTIQRFQIVPQGHGIQRGVIQIEDQDALDVDNRVYFGFFIPEHLDVLLVGDGADVFSTRLALAPSPDEKALLKVSYAARSSWDVAPLDRFQVIIFEDPPTVNRIQALRLQKFVESGGGVLLFPGNHTDVGALNRELLNSLDTPLWGESVRHSFSDSSFLTWRAPDLGEPLLRDVLRLGSQPASPHFFQALRLVGESAETLLQLSDGSPLLTQTNLGQGRIILAASSPHPDWSDWATRGIFAPLLHRLVLRLAQSGRETCHSLDVGDDFEVGVSVGDFGATLLTPEGQEIKLPPLIEGQRVLYRHAQVNPAGHYRLQSGAAEYVASVNVPAGESDLTAPDIFQVLPRWQEAGALKTSPDHLVETVAASRHGRELWKMALVTGLIVLLAESVVGSSFKSSASAAKEET
jgi:hypothetical protein